MIHPKGVSHDSKRLDGIYIVMFIIIKVDVVGYDYRPENLDNIIVLPHYSGNFWWANAHHINKLSI